MSKRLSPSPLPAPVGPFPRPFDVDRMSDAWVDEAIEATEAERTAIVADLGLAGLAGLAATFRLERRAGGRLAVGGRLQASITQICVVSLDPFSSLIEREIEVEFAPQAQPAAVEITPHRSRRREPPEREAAPLRPVVVPGNDDQDDPPDPIVNGRIDLGAITLEFLSLALDLYPRKPGVEFLDVRIGEADDADGSPFAALQRLKDRS